MEDCCKQARGNFCSTCGEPLSNGSTLLDIRRHIESMRKKKQALVDEIQGQGERSNFHSYHKARVKALKKVEAWLRAMDEVIEARKGV